MTISISNVTVNNGAPWHRYRRADYPGCFGQRYSVHLHFDAEASAGYFGISGNQLVAAWSTPPTPGYYSVRIQAIGTTTGSVARPDLQSMW